MTEKDKARESRADEPEDGAGSRPLTRMTVYLCGGINGLSDAACRDWREQAKAVLPHTLDPLRRDYRGREDEAVSAIVAGDLADIGDCDALLVNATRPSWGTAMEIVYAYKIGKRIVAFTGGGSVSPWLRYHCEVVRTLDEALGLLS